MSKSYFFHNNLIVEDDTITGSLGASDRGEILHIKAKDLKDSNTAENGTNNNHISSMRLDKSTIHSTNSSVNVSNASTLYISEPPDQGTNVTLANKYALYVASGTTYLGGDLNLRGTVVNATAAELNILDGVTATTAELNILGGVPATASELNILDGVTSTAAQLNLLTGSSAGTIVNSKAVVYGSSGEVNATTLQIAGTPITATAAELNILDGVTATATELNILDGVTATAAELNLLGGITDVKTSGSLASTSTKLATENVIKSYVDSVAQGLDVKDSVR